MTTRPLLFDDTTLTALFDAHPRVYALWRAAEENSIQVLFPAAAVFASNLEVKGSDNAWYGGLAQPNVVTLDLTSASALTAGRFSSDLAIAQTYTEAVASDATIITSRSRAYGPARVITFS